MVRFLMRFVKPEPTAEERVAAAKAEKATREAEHAARQRAEAAALEAAREAELAERVKVAHEVLVERLLRDGTDGVGFGDGGGLMSREQRLGRIFGGWSRSWRHSTS